MRHKRILVRGAWCVVTSRGIVIGKHAPRLRRPPPLPKLDDPLAPARGIVWSVIAGLLVWALVLLGYLLGGAR